MTDRVDRFLAALNEDPYGFANRRAGDDYAVIDGAWTVDQIEAALAAAMAPCDDEATQAMR